MAVLTTKLPRSNYLAAIILILIWTGWFMRHHFVPSSPPFFPLQSTDKINSLANSTSTRPLILYAYYDTLNARKNLQFFLTHGLHGSADFVFIFNGGEDVSLNVNGSSLPTIPDMQNVRIVRRANECYDLGAFADVLIDDDLYKKYNRFITMNASIRGPFLPYWSRECWSDLFLSRVTEETKLVGMTLNCEGPLPHIQSMIWATDSVGMETLLFPTETQISDLVSAAPSFRTDTPVPPLEPLSYAGINACPEKYWDAVAIEVYASALIRAAGWKTDALMMAYHSYDGYLSLDNKPRSNEILYDHSRDGKSEGADGTGVGVGIGITDGVTTGAKRPGKEGKGRTIYEEECIAKEYVDVLYEDSYFGINLSPWESIFAKANRGTNEKTLQLYTEWVDGRAYSSWDYCPG